MRLPIYFSDGFGVESTAAVLRWLLEPESRVAAGHAFDLTDLTLVSAQVGHEWRDTIAARERYLLPMLRAAGVRVVEVARAGAGLNEETGVVVLHDGPAPRRLHPEGRYTLGDAMQESGTVPQSAGEHLCSIHFKAWPIDFWFKHLERPRLALHGYGYNADETTRAAKCDAANKVRVGMGFNADELARAARAGRYDGEARAAFFPLVEWGWTRAACLDYIREKLGVTWRKSACTFCPFNRDGANRTAEGLARFRQERDAAARALLMEHAALAMNPRAGALYGTRTMRSVMDGEAAILAEFDRLLERAGTRLYSVRRFRTAAGAVGRCVEYADRLPANLEAEQIGPHTYHHARRRNEGFAYAEHYYVEAPAVVRPKCRNHDYAGFNDKFEQACKDATRRDNVKNAKQAAKAKSIKKVIVSKAKDARARAASESHDVRGPLGITPAVQRAAEKVAKAYRRNKNQPVTLTGFSYMEKRNARFAADRGLLVRSMNEAGAFEYAPAQ